jgi:hypothetical protein
VSYVPAVPGADRKEKDDDAMMTSLNAIDESTRDMDHHVFE